MFIGAAVEFSLFVALAVGALMAVIFVGAIQAIVVTIADVYARDAIAVVAREQIAEARLCPRLAVIWRFIGT